jgi:hypothetical protein
MVWVAVPLPLVLVSNTTVSMPIPLPPAALTWSWVIVTDDSDVTWAQVRPASVLFHRPAWREPKNSVEG